MRGIAHGESWKVSWAIGELWIKAKKCLYEGVIVPTVLHEQRHGAWKVLREGKLMFLRFSVWKFWLVRHEYRVGNEEVRRRAGIERELASRAYQRVLRWFGHVERMDENRIARRVLMTEVNGGPVRGRPRLGWMDSVQVALGNRGRLRDNVWKIGKRREPWCMCNWMSFTRPFLPASVFFRTALRCSGGLARILDTSRRCQVYGLRGAYWVIAYVCVIWLDMTTPP